MGISSSIKKLGLALLLIAAAAALLVWNTNRYGERRYAEGVAWQQQQDRDAAARQEKANRDTEHRHAQELAAAQELAGEQLEAARADADSATRSADKFRMQLAEVRRILNSSAAGADPTAKPAGATARDSALLLADVLEKSVERNRELAAYADRARLAGQLCERSYDTVRN